MLQVGPKVLTRPPSVILGSAAVSNVMETTSFRKFYAPQPHEHHCVRTGAALPARPVMRYAAEKIMLRHCAAVLQ